MKGLAGSIDWKKARTNSERVKEKIFSSANLGHFENDKKQRILFETNKEDSVAARTCETIGTEQDYT